MDDTARMNCEIICSYEWSAVQTRADRIGESYGESLGTRITSINELRTAAVKVLVFILVDVLRE